MAVARRAGEAEDDDIGLVAADDPDHIREDLVVAPFFEGFLRGFGEPEIDGAGEELLGSIDAAGGQEFLGADHAEEVALLRPNQVLAAFAACSGEISRLQFAAPRPIRQGGGVFIIWMSRDHQHAAEYVEAAEREFDFRRTREVALRECRDGERDGKTAGKQIFHETCIVPPCAWRKRVS